jgi:adenylate cyclase class IV
LPAAVACGAAGAAAGGPKNSDAEAAMLVAMGMGRNIELKARVRNDFTAAHAAIQYLPAAYQGEVWQRDVYFYCADRKDQESPSRIKLRGESLDGQNWEWQFIWYARANSRKSKASDYRIAPIIVPDPVALAETLDAAWGKYAEVDKHRLVYIYQDRVRIHLDEVVSLGRFIEFEAMIQGEDEQQPAHDHLKRLMNLFQVEDGDLVEISYGDMIRNEIYRLGRA